MDIEEPKKSINISKGQLGFGSVIVMAIMILNPIKEWFYTREEGKAQQVQIAALQTELVNTREELTRRLERNADKIIGTIKDAEARSSKAEERLDRRIDNVEYVLNIKSRKSTN